MPSINYEQVRQQVLQLSEQDRKRLLEELLEGVQKQPLGQDYSLEMKWLDENRHLYRGQHLAVSGERLIAHGTDPKLVHQQAKAAGVEQFLLAWVEPENHIEGNIWE
ncbi:MAG TPA: DUF5678 domain-containing protein [Blastocatellia bacterium]|nr:DUF5678 domain-containing protein [Blastocatellia bacterium]